MQNTAMNENWMASVTDVTRFAKRLCLGMSLNAWLLVASSAQAEMMDQFHFSGFATLGAGKLYESEAHFIDYHEAWSFKSDTILGGQIQFQASDRWAVTGQVVARGFNFDNKSDFEPVLEWLFTSYQLTPETRVRAGRLRTPFYLYSESLEIGYSYPWVRPPVDAYSFLLSPLSHFDGADVTATFDAGFADIDVQVFAGVTESEYFDFNIQINTMLGANLVARWQDVTFRYGATFVDTDASSVALQPLIDGFNQFAVIDPIFAEIASSHKTESEWFQYHGLGIQWEYQRWTFLSEQYAIIGPGKDFSNDAFGWYISVSRQIGAFVPYAVVGYYRNKFSDEIENLIEQSKLIVVPGAIPSLDSLRQVDASVAQGFNEHGNTYTAGVRYDFLANAALKLEVEYFDSTAQLRGNISGSASQDAWLTTVVIDVVF